MSELTKEKLETLVHSVHTSLTMMPVSPGMVREMANELLVLYQLREAGLGDPDQRCEQYKADLRGSLLDDDALQSDVDAAAEAFHDGLTEGIARAASMLQEQYDATEAMKEGFAVRAQELETSICGQDELIARLRDRISQLRGPSM